MASPYTLNANSSPGPRRHYMACPSPVSPTSFSFLHYVLATLAFWIFLGYAKSPPILQPLHFCCALCLVDSALIVAWLHSSL